MSDDGPGKRFDGHSRAGAGRSNRQCPNGDQRPVATSGVNPGGKRGVAARAAMVAPFRVMELSAKAFEYERCGEDVVHFQVGEPDFTTCEPVLEAGRTALTTGHTKYTESLGIPPLRQAIANFYATTYGVEVDPRSVVVTAGASGALTLLLATLFDAGSELLMADPGYPSNSAFAHLVGAIPRLIPTTAEVEFQPTADAVAALWGAASRGLLLASPANPTGGMLTASNLTGLVDTVARRGGIVLLDEIYSGLVYEDRPDSYRCGWELRRELFIVNSFSKYFGMTGWRLGWLLAPDWALEPLTRFAQHLFISPSAPAQHAAIAAFGDLAMAEHERRREILWQRRDLLVSGLRELGFGVPFVPGGGVFLYVNIEHTGMDAETFCWRLIDEYKVAVTPGTDFGSYQSTHHVRFAFTTSTERIEVGLERLRLALRAWGCAGEGQ